MHDVVGVVVLTVRDENLLAEELVCPISLRHRARAHCRKIGASLRLGQVHRAGPVPDTIFGRNVSFNDACQSTR